MLPINNKKFKHTIKSKIPVWCLPFNKLTKLAIKDATAAKKHTDTIIISAIISSYFRIKNPTQNPHKNPIVKDARKIKTVSSLRFIALFDILFFSAACG